MLPRRAVLPAQAASHKHLCVRHWPRSSGIPTATEPGRYTELHYGSKAGLQRYILLLPYWCDGSALLRPVCHSSYVRSNHHIRQPHYGPAPVDLRRTTFTGSMHCTGLRFRSICTFPRGHARQYARPQRRNQYQHRRSTPSVAFCVGAGVCMRVAARGRR